MTNRDFFKIYAHNIPVKGKLRSAIYNLQQGAIVIIPNILYDILQYLREQSLPRAQAEFAPGNDALFDTYIKFLLDKDLGFITRQPNSFPELSLNWSLPCTINTAVVEYHFNHYAIKSAIKQLDRLLCRHLEFRFAPRSHHDIKNVEQLLRYTEGKVFRSVSLLIRYHDALREVEAVDRLYQACEKIEHIIVYDAPVDTSHRNVRYTQRAINALRNTKRQYIVNTHYFLESQQFNPYYNQKVCIDKKGNIKNCLQYQQAYGNINEDQLAEVIDRPAFRELWRAAPDKIEGIKDSELRYCLFMPYQLLKDNLTENYRIVESTEHTQTVSYA